MWQALLHAEGLEIQRGHSHAVVLVQCWTSVEGVATECGAGEADMIQTEVR